MVLRAKWSKLQVRALMVRKTQQRCKTVRRKVKKQMWSMIKTEKGEV